MPFIVSAKALDELSMKRLDWQVKRLVPLMVVAGAVGIVALCALVTNLILEI